MLICQLCNNQMKKGYLQSIREIFWSEYKRDDIVLPWKTDIKLGKTLFPNYLDSYLCPNCKTITVKYE